MLDLHLDQTRQAVLYRTVLHYTVMCCTVFYCNVYRFGVLKLQWLAGKIKERGQGVIIVRFVDQIEVVKVYASPLATSFRGYI